MLMFVSVRQERNASHTDKMTDVNGSLYTYIYMAQLRTCVSVVLVVKVEVGYIILY